MSFDVHEYLMQAIPDVKMLDYPETRRALCANDPLLFALIYLPEHIKDDNMGITFSEFHLALVDYAKTWTQPLTNPAEYRDAWIAPRECGKTTWLFLILPMWAAAFGYIKFVAAFSEAAMQAQRHLLTFKRELDQNELLQTDFPELCNAARVQTTGRTLANSNHIIVQENGFAFAASGADVSNHGIKVGNRRPDFLLLDDIEPGESNYSEYEMKKRLNTIWDDIAPMNMRARMVIVGTTQMPNSVIDQLRKYAEGEIDDTNSWIADQNINVHYFPAIMTDEEGNERSVWPEKWSMEWLNSKRHQRDFAKNFMNRPVSSDGQFWQEAHVKIRTSNEGYKNTILSVDPAVTKGKVSDYTGLVVLSRGVEDKKVYIRYATQVKMSPAELSEKIQKLVEEFEVGLIYVETNQGGDLWKDAFRDVDCRMRTIHQKVSKEVRCGKALNHYERERVFHTGHFPVLLEQMYAFPKVRHDDVLDAMTSGVLYYLGAGGNGTVAVTQINYV